MTSQIISTFFEALSSVSDHLSEGRATITFTKPEYIYMRHSEDTTHGLIKRNRMSNVDKTREIGHTK